MSHTWFREQIAPDGATEDGCHPDEAQALQSYLDNKTTPQEAAHAITQPILSSDDIDDNIWRLWNLLQLALVELSAAHIPRLIDLLQAIQALPDPDLGPKPTETEPSKNAFSWKGLPSFGHMWADTYRRDLWQDDLSSTLASIPSPSDRLKKRQELRAEHIRKATIEAHLVVANIGDFPIDWGYNTIADALEVNAAVLDFEIPATREWLRLAGKELYQGAKEGYETLYLDRKRDMGRENKRMSLSRWEFWEDRIRACREQAEVVVDAAKGVGDEMNKSRVLESLYFRRG